MPEQTFRQYAHAYLSPVLTPEAVTQIISAMIADPANAPMRDRWDEGTSRYPAVIMTLAKMAINRAAAAYLHEHEPAHFALPLFDPNVTCREQMDKAQAIVDSN